MGITDILDMNDRGEFFDIAETVVTAPNKEDIQLRNEEELLIRLDRIQSPRERIKEFLLSQLFLHDAPTHEALTIRGMTISGLLFGWLFGGLARSRGITEEYVRKQNAAVFDGMHRAKREYVDTYVYNIIKRGAKFGIGTCVLSTTAGLIGFGSIAYRNRIYYPDWLIGFATLGAVSRCWLGLRGIVAGAGLGLAAGVFGLGFAKSVELLSDRSVTQMRYQTHVEYLERREAQLSAQQRMRQSYDRKIISRWL